MIKNDIVIKKDIDRCTTLIAKIEELRAIYDGYIAIINDKDTDKLWKYNYFRGKDFNIDEIREDFVESFNDLIIDYVNEEDSKEEG